MEDGKLLKTVSWMYLPPPPKTEEGYSAGREAPTGHPFCKLRKKASLSASPLR